MKNFLATILAFGMLAWAGSAMATSVTFDVDGPNDSYVNLSNIFMYGTTSISATLADLANTPDFTLDDNESKTIDYFTFSLTGAGLGTFDLESNLHFDTPDITVGGTGAGGWGVWGGS